MVVPRFEDWEDAVEDEPWGEAERTFLAGLRARAATGSWPCDPTDTFSYHGEGSLLVGVHLDAPAPCVRPARRWRHRARTRFAGCCCGYSNAVNAPSNSSSVVADVDPVELAAAYGTPLLVTDLTVLRSRSAALRSALPAGSALLYSMKANPCPPVVATLQESGCGTEVSSLGELAVALGAAAAAEPLLYTGPGKSPEELRAAVEAGAALSCESAVELDRLRGAVEVPPGTRLPVLLRVQPSSRSSAGLSMADGRQFGLLEDEVTALCRAVPADIDVVGFHCYLGSQLPTVEALLTAFTTVVDLVERIVAATGTRPRIVNLGGGFPWPYATAGTGPDLTDLAGPLTEAAAPLTRAGARLWFESGRGLVAAAGRLVTRVMDIKERGGKTIVVVDAGVNVLGGMSGLGRVLAPSTAFVNLSAAGGDPVTADVVGPLCTPLDRLSVRASIPRPRVGDLLCVENVGAYATTAALSGFLSRPPAAEVIIDAGRVVGVWRLATGHVRDASAADGPVTPG
jgi:diaminopimelate decarboxylase